MSEVKSKRKLVKIVVTETTAKEMLDTYECLLHMNKGSEDESHCKNIIKAIKKSIKDVEPSK